MMKKLALMATLAAGVLASAGSWAATWTVATEPTFAPFEFKDTKTDQFVGFDIDLIQAIAEVNGDDIKIVSMGFDAIIPALMSGTVDVGASGFTITEERAKKVNFSDSYYVAGLSILIRKDMQSKINGIEDLKGRVICAQIGTSGQMRAKTVPNAKVRSFNSQADAFIELSNRGCDAVIGDRPVTGYFMSQKPANEKIFKHLSQQLDPEDYGFVVAKSNPELLAKIQKGLQTVRANGTYDKLYRKWFGR